MSPPIPPKPPARPDRASFWRYLRLMRRDILSAHPARLYRAWMAEFRTPFFRSYLCNDPEIVTRVLKAPNREFPKSNRMAEGLRPLLGRSVFLTNGPEWERQRRIIDPAFEGGRLHESLPAMEAAACTAVARLAPRADGQPVEIEAETAHAAADAIFRTLFSIPIEGDLATAAFAAFRAHQATQPLVNLGAFLPLPRWVPRLHSARTRATARAIRAPIRQMVAARADEIAAGTAPDDLATKIMTTADPDTGSRFAPAEMVDQVATFFLAGHETSASALAWSLYLLALFPDWQDRLAAEAAGLDPAGTDMAALGRLRVARAVFREAMRLYPPVPMMVREAACPVTFRGRALRPGAQIVISPWHLHRHERLWARPDEFAPDRFDTDTGRACLRTAYIPFSSGPRACPGAGFAMAEGPLMLAHLVAAYRFDPVPGRTPMPAAQLTVRSKDGIWLRLTRRDQSR